MMFSKELLPKVLDGTKTQSRRPYKPNVRGVYYTVGKIVAVQPGGGKKAVAYIRITNVTIGYVWPISRKDAIAEGFKSPKEFREKWESFYGPMNESQTVWHLEFELVKDTK